MTAVKFKEYSLWCVYEIYTYKSMYEEAGNDLTGANFAHVDGNGENH